MNKFKCNDVVRFVGDDRNYMIFRVYKTETGYKYDLQSSNGVEVIVAMPEEVLKLKEVK